MSTITKTLSMQEIMDLKKHYIHAKECKTPPYAVYQIRLSDCVITAYQSGKVVFQGEGADFHAEGAKSEPKPNAVYPQCGSDEVGTGDYFGPVTVCATCVKEEDVQYLKDLGIQDSKAMKDSYILEIAPKLIQRLPYSLLILDNAKYNKVHPIWNMVGIKCMLHNQAYVHLKHKMNGLPSFLMIDQFVQKSSYYRYLKNEKEVVPDIHFETKAENKYLSVACGAVIARYAFLKAMESLDKKYNFTFPKGAGSKVDEAIVQFVNKYGKEELKNVAKLHFSNTKKALGE